MGEEQWAERMLNEYREDRGRLVEYRRIHENELPEDEKTLINSMINELEEKIVLVAPYCHSAKHDGEIAKMERDIYFKRGNISLWEPQWIERCPDAARFENALIERLDGEEQEELITVDLSFLPKRQREAIQMVADGLSYTQAAEMMDQVKKGTVSKHLQLARKKCQGDSLQLSWNL